MTNSYMGKSGPLKIDYGSVCPLVVITSGLSNFFRLSSQVIDGKP